MPLNKLNVLFISLMCVSTSISAKPCPEIQTIISVGLNKAEVSKEGWSASFAPYYKYTEDTNWFFAIGSHSLKNLPSSNSEAISRGLKLLSTLKFVNSTEYGDVTICNYSTSDKKVIAGAITPVQDMKI